jgi:putative oxidoreductase
MAQHKFDITALGHGSTWTGLPVRLVVGYGFMEHGFAKLSRGPDVFIGILTQLGVPFPHLAGWLAIGTEVLGGLAVLLGLFVLWASIPMAIVLLVAMFTVHWQCGFSSVRLLGVSAAGARFGPVGFETDLLYCLPGLTHNARASGRGALRLSTTSGATGALRRTLLAVADLKNVCLALLP